MTAAMKLRWNNIQKTSLQTLKISIQNLVRTEILKFRNRAGKLYHIQMEWRKFIRITRISVYAKNIGKFCQPLLHYIDFPGFSQSREMHVCCKIFEKWTIARLSVLMVLKMIIFVLFVAKTDFFKQIWGVQFLLCHWITKKTFLKQLFRCNII